MLRLLIILNKICFPKPSFFIFISSQQYFAANKEMRKSIKKTQAIGLNGIKTGFTSLGMNRQRQKI